MKNKIKIASAVSAILVSSTALGVTGMDRLVFSPSIMFEEGNYAELTLANSNPFVSSTVDSSANVAENVNTVRLGYKHQVNDKFAVGLIINNQPVGVDIDYKDHPGAVSVLRGSVSAKSYTALGLYKATENISAFGGLKYHSQEGNAVITQLPGQFTFDQDSDTGYILGAAYSIPKIAFRASLSYESDLEFSHNTTNPDPAGNGGYNAPISVGGLGGGNTTSATPKSLTLELQSGIAKNTLLFGSIRRAKWADAQVALAGVSELSIFSDTTAFTLGVGRKFNDSFSGSITANYQKGTDKAVSEFSPQDGERGIAIGGKYTSKNGFITSLGVQYRELGDATTRTAGLPFEDNKIVTVGLKFAKRF